MKQMRARRNFYSDGRIEKPRRIIRRGELFETSDQHATELERQGIASVVEPLGPSNTQVKPPAEQPAPGPAETPSPNPPETKLDEPASPETGTPDGLDQLDTEQLRAKAKLAKIKSYSNMRRDKLIKKLREANQNG